MCRLFGKTRHAYYDHQWRVQDEGLKDEIVLQHVSVIRETQKRIGTMKLWHIIEPQLISHNIKVGRDYLFDLMRSHGMLIRR